MDLEAIACQKGDAWQNSATAAAARMRGRDGFFTIQLNATDAATIQAALALAAPALDAELQRDPTVGKALVKVRPGSALFPAPPAYEQAATLMDNIARTGLPLLMRGIGLRADALSGILDDINLPSMFTSSCELHVVRYRGPYHGSNGAHAAGGAQTHVDQTVLTIIAADTVDGLQVGEGSDGRAVPLQPGQVAVLGGHTLEFATGGALRATHHRVVVGQPRMALVYKFKANVDATIDLSKALSAAGASCSGLEHPMRVGAYSRQFDAEHDSINAADRPGYAVRVLPVEALSGGSAAAPSKRAQRRKRRAAAQPQSTPVEEEESEKSTTVTVRLLDGGRVIAYDMLYRDNIDHLKRRIEAGAAIPLRRQRIYYEGTELAGHLTIMDLVLPKMSHEDRSRGAALPRLGNLDVLTEPPLSTVWVSADMEGEEYELAVTPDMMLSDLHQLAAETMPAIADGRSGGRVLMYRGKALLHEGSTSMEACGIYGNAALYLLDGMTICVKTSNGTNLQLDNVTAATSVEGVKELIHVETGIPVDQQRIIHAGRQLDDRRLMVEYGIEDGSTVFLVLRLRGD